MSMQRLIDGMYTSPVLGLKLIGCQFLPPRRLGQMSFARCLNLGSYEPIPQAAPPPSFHESPFHDSLPGSPGAGIVQNRQTSLPVFWSSAAMKPRAPNSPPPKPVITRFFTIVGGDVMTEPWV